MRIAFIDLLFSWPPHGGACTAVYHTITGLQALGHETRLFAAAYDGAWERGAVDPASLPFPCTLLEFDRRTFHRRRLAERFRAVVDEWSPDVIYLADAFFLKPYLVEALASYPLLARFYAYEATCPRDFRLFKNGARCPNNYLYTPNECRSCAVRGQRTRIQAWRLDAWSHEYLAARAVLPGYYQTLIAALERLGAIIVANEVQASQLRELNPNVFIIPEGVDITRFAYTRAPDDKRSERAIILMAGRAEDPAKGMATLREAAERLDRERKDFQVWITHPDHRLNSDYFKAIGWRDQEAVADLYAQADICVVPSVWEEPFGLVAVEAMATGRPVCASRVGGLQDIVVHGETGFLFQGGDVGALAGHLNTLLDDADLRKRMGAAARKRVEEHYDWNRIIPNYYPPILETLKS